MADINDIKTRTIDKVDPCEFVEACGITIHELVEAFPEKMMESVEELGVEDQDDEEDN